MTLVSIDKVSVGLNRRPLKDQKVTELMESIQANGLLNPVTLDQHFNLVAGLHRLTACKLLGLTEIECRIVDYQNQDQARLAEIDENLIRNELEALERSELWLERDQILERMGLRAKAGDNQYSRRGGETISRAVKTTLELAKEAGYTDRTFQQGKQIARDIAPEVKAKIKGTPIAKSPTALLKIARAGKLERQPKATENKPNQTKSQQAEEAQQKQAELQLMALYHTTAEREAKQTAKQIQRTQLRKPESAEPLPSSKAGEDWLLGRHSVYCGDPTSQAFIDRLPSDAALAIATPTSAWQHDYLIDKARVVAVLCPEGQVHQFCTRHRLPFQFEILLRGIYLAVFSRHSLTKPDQPLEIAGVESVVAYLISLYTKPGNFVIHSSIGYGEVLIACEKMGRVCFTGDQDLQRVDQAIARWQKWTGKQAEKVALYD
jgi:ParB family transcriptional regulator, chromosome partitioning protein